MPLRNLSQPLRTPEVITCHIPAFLVCHPGQPIQDRVPAAPLNFTGGVWASQSAQVLRAGRQSPAASDQFHNAGQHAMAAIIAAWHPRQASTYKDGPSPAFNGRGTRSVFCLWRVPSPAFNGRGTRSVFCFWRVPSHNFLAPVFRKPAATSNPPKINRQRNGKRLPTFEKKGRNWAG